MDHLEFFTPSWPTLFPLWLTYKRDPPFPLGRGEIDEVYGNLANEWQPQGLKGRDMYYKYFSLFIINKLEIN
jgi:hypothetical protein